MVFLGILQYLVSHRFGSKGGCTLALLVSLFCYILQTKKLKESVDRFGPTAFRDTLALAHQPTSATVPKINCIDIAISRDIHALITANAAMCMTLHKIE